MSKKQRIPVIIITGFLGSGKTTVLNCLLKKPDLESTAVIINEFGEIGIDHLLVETSTEQLIEMNNGCICCTIRGDLSDKLQSLAMWLETGRIPSIERVIVETTGLADPAPIMHTLMTDEDLLRRYELSHVATIVDAVSGASTLDRFPEAVKQVAVADSIIVSKLDLVKKLSSHEAFLAYKRRLKNINPRAKFYESKHGKVEISAIIPAVLDSEYTHIDGFSQWLDVAENVQTKNKHEASCHKHEQRHEGIKTFLVETDKPLDTETFNNFLQELVIEFGENILRMKGIICTQQKPSQPAVIQSVQHVFFPIYWLDAWPDNDRSSKLVFITQGLDPENIVSKFDDYFLNSFGSNSPQLAANQKY